RLDRHRLCLRHELTEEAVDERIVRISLGPRPARPLLGLRLLARVGEALAAICHVRQRPEAEVVPTNRPDQFPLPVESLLLSLVEGIQLINDRLPVRDDPADDVQLVVLAGGVARLGGVAEESPADALANVERADAGSMEDVDVEWL